MLESVQPPTSSVAIFEPLATQKDFEDNKWKLLWKKREQVCYIFII